MGTSTVHVVIADNLDRLLKSAGWTREKFAKKVGTSKSTLTPVMNPDSGQPPTTRSLERFAEALRVPAWMLLLPDAPAERHQVRELQQVIEAWLDGNTERPADPLAELPQEEADLILSYRSLQADGREGLKMLLASVKTTADKPYIPLAPPGGLSAVAEPLPASPARAKRR